MKNKLTLHGMEAAAGNTDAWATLGNHVNTQSQSLNNDDLKLNKMI